MAFLKTGKTNWKYILIVLISAAIVGVGILWWTKTQEVPFAEFPEIKKPEKFVTDETVGWKTFRSSDFSCDIDAGYEIKYPSDLVVNDWGRATERCPAAAPYTVSFLKTQDQGNIEIIKIDSLNIGDTDEKIYEVYKMDGGIPIEINGIKGLKRSDGALLLIKSGRINWITGNYSEFKDLFNQILSTFKFIEKDETADWKAYRNEEYGFEFRYPATFLATDIVLPTGIRISSENFKGTISGGIFIGEEKKSMEECIINSESVSEEQMLSAPEDKKIIGPATFYQLKNYPEFIGGYCGMSSGCWYQDIYRTFYKDYCYEVKYERSDREFIEGNPYGEHEVTGNVTEVPEIFNQMLSTFRFIE